MKLKDNFCLIISSLFLIRLLITGANIGDAIALFSLLSLYGFKSFLEYKQIFINKQLEISKNNEELQNTLVELRKDVDHLKTMGAAQKVATSLTNKQVLKF